jgi:SAM-dependent methyltransferase
MAGGEATAPPLERVVRTDAYLAPGRLDVPLVASGGHTEFSAEYEERFKDAIDAGESIYEPMPPLVWAAHERRMALLDALDVGPLEDRVVVDFGVGSWTVACIAQKLQRCGLAIGIDISEHAVRESARLSDDGDYPYGDRWAYLVSNGRTIDLHDESVDLLFAGEVIEHIDHTEAWLDEVHRVLRPGGTFIVTTPNADAHTYRATGEEWCVGPEHVALMGYDELRRRLEPRFEIDVAKGFMMSVHATVDGRVTDPDLAAQWAACCVDRPDLANGLILQCRRRDSWRRPSRRVEDIEVTGDRIRWHGAWSDAELHGGLTGRAGMHGASAGFDFDGNEVILQFWVHPWSGEVAVDVDGAERAVRNLYSPYGGFRRVIVEDLPGGRHTVVVRATGERHASAEGCEVILHHVLTARVAV